jgi:hypothetical protein
MVALGPPVDLLRPMLFGSLDRRDDVAGPYTVNIPFKPQMQPSTSLLMLCRVWSLLVRGKVRCRKYSPSAPENLFVSGYP